MSRRLHSKRLLILALALLGSTDVLLLAPLRQRAEQLSSLAARAPFRVLSGRAFVVRSRRWSGTGRAPSGQTAKSDAPAQIDSESLFAQADDLLREMSRMTGLPVKGPLKKQIVSRKEVEAYLIDNLHAQYTDREMHIQQATLEAFGLVPRGFDLRKFLIAFYTEQAAGFYDPRRKTMLMADWVSPEMQKLVLAHELTHALEDQNYDLEKFIHAVKDNDDATAARQAVVEGHATAAMIQQLVPDLAALPILEPLMSQVVVQQMEAFPAFKSAPYFFRFQSLFPYTEGMGFMQRGLQLGGWSKLNALFLNPPTTTKEIFDPAVYFDRKPLPKVDLPRPAPLASAKSLEFLSENTAGELGYRELIGQFISEAEARSVTSRWLADRYLLYESPLAHQYALVVRTRWSSADAALAFFRDYSSIFAKKYPDLARDKRSSSDLFLGTAVSSGQVILLRKGDECLWAEGIPAAQADAMFDWLRSL